MPKTKEDIQKKIIAMAGSMKPEEIRSKLLSTHYEKYVPKIRAIYDIIRKNKDKIKNNPIDGPWSLASLTKYPVSYEFISMLLLIQDDLRSNGATLTIREALWICRLIKVPIANPINSNSTEKEIQDFHSDLLLDAFNFAMQEHICELDGKEPDTSMLEAPTREEIRENIRKNNESEIPPEELEEMERDPKGYLTKQFKGYIEKDGE